MEQCWLEQSLILTGNCFDYVETVNVIGQQSSN